MFRCAIASVVLGGHRWIVLAALSRIGVPVIVPSDHPSQLPVFV
ncbi:MAG: hypothetical protein P8R54_32220 [Myxococcota bacterium]|nr:hypothetical protein [Myxococcota bacterium]